MKSGFSRNRLKYSVNEKFFDKWTSQIAYVLGFTFADGNIYKNSLAWDIQKRDLNILKKINCILKSTYPIIERKNSVRLRINNQLLIKNAQSVGLLPKKSLRLSFPKIPNKLIRHFIRGYLDGDGWLVIRKKGDEIDLGFVCGNRSFLEDLSGEIYNSLGIYRKVREKNKITKKGFKSKTFLLEYYSSNAVVVANWLYGYLDSNDLYLDRKYKKYLKVKKLSEYLKSGTKKVRVIQKQLQKTLIEILNDLYLDKHLDGVKIANILHVHSSSVYRWLERTGIRYVAHRNNYE